MNYSVIRSADTRVGAEMANAFAQKGRNLILLGISQAKLDRAAGRIVQQYGVRAAYYVVDESDTQDIIRICNLLNDHFHIDTLVNYARFRDAKALLQNDIFSLDKKLKVACIATPAYIHQLLPNLSLYGGACILNIADVPHSPMQSMIRKLNTDLTESMQQSVSEADVTMLAFDFEERFSGGPGVDEISRLLDFISGYSHCLLVN